MFISDEGDDYIMRCGYDGVLSRGRGYHTVMWEPKDCLENYGCKDEWCPSHVAPVIFHCQADIKPADFMGGPGGAFSW